MTAPKLGDTFQLEKYFSIIDINGKQVTNFERELKNFNPNELEQLTLKKNYFKEIEEEKKL